MLLRGPDGGVCTHQDHIEAWGESASRQGQVALRPSLARPLTRHRLTGQGLTINAPLRAGITQVLSVRGAMIVEGVAFRLGSQMGRRISE